MKKRVLELLMDGFEEIEALAPVDILRRAGIEVTLASCSEDLLLEGAHGIKTYADIFLKDVAIADYDLLLLPGGPAVFELRQNEAVLQLIQEAYHAKKFLAANCAAPLLLKDAGLLEGKHFTAHFSTFDELLGADEKMKVVEDSLLVTACGPGGTAQFSFVLVSKLLSPEVAREVSQAMCY